MRLAMSEYEKNIETILEKINKKENIIRAPKSKEIQEILTIMYDEKDAAIGALMDIFSAYQERELLLRVPAGLRG